MLSFKKEINVISTKNKLINIVIFIATLSTLQNKDKHLYAYVHTLLAIAMSSLCMILT